MCEPVDVMVSRAYGIWLIFNIAEMTWCVQAGMPENFSKLASVTFLIIVFEQKKTILTLVYACPHY